MKRVYVVNLSVDVPVLAEDDTDAENVALSFIRDIGANEDFDAFGRVGSVRPEFFGCLPYGGDGRTTVRDYESARALAQKELGNG